jgi:nucleotide-binding universal stress UspA family protein
LERLLLAVDESANGRFAAHLAGLIAAPRGLPITVLPVQLTDKPQGSDSNEPDAKNADLREHHCVEAVRTAADKSRNLEEHDTPPLPTDVTIRAPEQSTEEAVAREAKKGYDLLFVGIENASRKAVGFHQDVTQIAFAFEGPLAVAVARNMHLSQPQACPLNILVPINGTDVSRRAAEIAISIGRASKSRLTALYVASNNSNATRRIRGFRSQRQEEAILKEIVELADRYGYDITTAIETGATRDKPIISVAKQRGHDLIVMGVSRRSGQTLDFGDTAAAIFEYADCSILFVSSDDKIRHGASKSPP